MELNWSSPLRALRLAENVGWVVKVPLWSATLVPLRHCIALKMFRKPPH